MTKKYAKKQFLNKDGFNALAAIGYNISVDESGHVEAELTITDCSKQIYIELSDDWIYSSKKDPTEYRENNLEKINVLLEVLKSCKKDYILALKKSEKNKKKAKKKEKDGKNN